MKKEVFKINENLLKTFYSIFNKVTGLTTNVFKRNWETCILENAPFLDSNSFILLKKFLDELKEKSILIFPIQPSINDKCIRISKISKYDEFVESIIDDDYHILGGYIMGESLRWGCDVEVDNNLLYIGVHKDYKDILRKTFFRSKYLLTKEEVDKIHRNHLRAINKLKK